MLTIIGCGNLNRSDDGVGVVVAKRLRERFEKHPVPGVRVFDAGTAGMEVMFAARGSDALVLIDACRSDEDAPPGAIYRVPGAELETEYEPGASLHDFRWDHAIHAGRKIFGKDFPQQVDVWLVAAAELGLGLELSPSVAASADEVYRQVLERVANYAVNRHAGSEVEVGIERGTLTIDAETFEKFFREAPAVAVLRREAELLLLPLRDGFGGTLVKVKNPQGDRSVDLREFMRTSNLNEWAIGVWPARWDAELGGLALRPPDLSESPT